MPAGSTDPDAIGVGVVDALPRPPGAIRRFGARHPRLVDVGVALVCLVPTAGFLLIAGVLAPAEQQLWWVGIIASVLSSVALLWRRRHSFIVAIVCAALMLAPGQPTLFATYAALYAVGAYGGRAHRWIAFGVTALATFVGPGIATLAGLTPSSVGASDALAAATSFGVFGITTCLVAVTVGISVRSRRDYIDALISRGDDLRLQRDQEAQLAAATERARIAREMHDVVSHGITMMVTLAEGAAAQSSRDPARAADAMRTVATTGREALGEMRRLLGVLAEPSTDDLRSPQPTSGDLAALMERFRVAGLPLRWTVRGDRIEQPSLALAVHRIVQEALTNTLRHAAGTRSAEVVIEHRDGLVTVVVDDAGGALGAPTTKGAGRGIVGMRERAAVHAGAVEAGPRAEGGWRVRAVLGEETR